MKSKVFKLGFALNLQTSLLFCPLSLNMCMLNIFQVSQNVPLLNKRQLSCIQNYLVQIFHKYMIF